MGRGVSEEGKGEKGKGRKEKRGVRGGYGKGNGEGKGKNKMLVRGEREKKIQQKIGFRERENLEISLFRKK